ncbi:MAG: hypothetical protein B0A82_07625 [Alkalinema sp. CACIAM 70d]|nr:MAG: hypothetical protein B0A82_07625 [Alkalinema sp. CACIAM 70d]
MFPLFNDEYAEFQDYQFQHQHNPGFTTIDAMHQIARILMVLSSGLFLFLLSRTIPLFAPFCWIVGTFGLLALTIVAISYRDAQFWVMSLASLAAVLLAHWDLLLGGS